MSACPRRAPRPPPILFVAQDGRRTNGAGPSAASSASLFLLVVSANGEHGSSGPVRPFQGEERTPSTCPLRRRSPAFVSLIAGGGRIPGEQRRELDKGVKRRKASRRWASPEEHSRMGAGPAARAERTRSMQGRNRMVGERAASCETSRLPSRGCSSAGSSPHAAAFLRRRCRHGLARHRPPRVLLSAAFPFPRVLAFNAKFVLPAARS